MASCIWSMLPESVENKTNGMEQKKNTCYVSKGSYTIGFTQQKNFQSCTLLFLWPILAPHHLILAAFQDLLHLFVLVFLSPPCYFWQLLRMFCTCLPSSPSWLFLSLTAYFWWLFRIVFFSYLKPLFMWLHCNQLCPHILIVSWWQLWQWKVIQVERVVLVIV